MTATVSLAWFDALSRRLLHGQAAIILEGCMDGYPSPQQSRDDPLDMLQSWHAIVSRELREPNQVTWTYDPAEGLIFRTTDDEAAFRGKPEPKKKAANADPIARLREAMSDATDTDFVQGINALMGALATLRTREDHPSCRILIQDAEFLSQGASSATSEPVQRAYLKLFRLAESDWFRREGHVLILGVKDRHLLPARFLGQETPFGLVSAFRPSEEERRQFLSRVAVMSAANEHVVPRANLVRQGETLLQEAAETARAALERCSQEHAAELADVTAKADADYRHAVAALTATQDEKRSQVEALDAQITALRKSAGDVPLRPQELTADVWKRVQAGDFIVFATGIVGDDATGDRKQVLSCKDGDAVFSTATDPEQPLTHPEEGTPVIHYWAKGGLHQRRQSQKSGKLLVSQPNVLVLHDPASVRDIRLQIKALQAEIDNLSAKETPAAAERKQKALVAARDRLITEAAQQFDERLAKQEDALREAVSAQSARAYPRDIQRQLDELDGVPERRHEGYFVPEDGIDVTARLSQGMTFRDILRLLMASRGERRPLATADVVAARQGIIRRCYGKFFEIVTPMFGFDDVAGHDDIKAYFRLVATNIRAGHKAKVPMGCVLMGPPGTGKSALAEGFAMECGFLFVKMKSLRDMFVGNSERNMEEALKVLRDLSAGGIALYRDEIDQEDSGRDAYQGDTGVSNRIRQMMMTFLADPSIRGKVFSISCTNRPDLVDAALKREGRSDDRLAVLMPDDDERRALFTVMLRRFQKSLGDASPFSWEVSDAVMRDAVRSTAGLAGSAIEVIVRRAAEVAPVNGSGVTVVDDASLRHAFEGFIPSSNSAEARKMELLAVKECNRVEFLPKRWRERMRKLLAEARTVRQPDEESDAVFAAMPSLFDGKKIGVGEA